jgi:hypothetical protein
MECEFKFIQQWRSKLLFHIEQQLNISKTLRSAFPNHGTMTSVFLYQKSAFMNQPVLFISPDTCFCILHELLPAQDFRLLPMQCVSHFSFSLQDDSPINICVQIHSFQSVLVLQKKHKHLAQEKCSLFREGLSCNHIIFHRG